MPSPSAYHLTGVSLALDMGYLLRLLVLTLDVGYLLSAPCHSSTVQLLLAL